MKKIIKILCFTLTLTMLMTLTSLALEVQDDIIPETGTEQTEEETADGKAFSENIDYNTDFTDDCFIVILQHEFGVVNAPITADYFPEISDSISDIEDLSYIEDPADLTSDNEYLTRYKQMLCVSLKERGKEKVVEAISSLDGRIDICDVYPNYIYKNEKESTLPDDYGNYLEIKRAYDLIDLPEAWDITTGSSSVKVAVMDNGVLSHYDLSDNVITGYDAHNKNTITNDIPITTDDDEYSHGTHVAGIIGASGNNRRGIPGINRNVSIVPIQFWSEYVQDYNGEWEMHTNHVSFARAINYLNNNGIMITNCSLGFGYGYQEYRKYLIDNYRGLFVVAAGNEGTDLETFNWLPASFDCPNIIAVGNSTCSDTMGYMTNYGATLVDLFAPGTNISSTYVRYDNGNNVQTIRNMSGTSMAAPMVTGVAALIKSYNPLLSANDIKRIIIENVDKVSAFEGKCVSGGRLNAYKALNAATQVVTQKSIRFLGKTGNDNTDDLVEVRPVGDKYEILTYISYNGQLSNYSPMSQDDITTVKYYRTVTDFEYDPRYGVNVLSGDVNGDSYIDIVFIYASAERSDKRDITVHYGGITKYDDGQYDYTNGGRFETSKLTSTTNSADTEAYPSKFFVADATGDGVDDVVVMYRNPGGKRSILVYKSVSGEISALPISTVTEHTYVDTDPVFMGDVNGDDRADFIIHWEYNNQRRLTVLTSLGTSYVTQGNTLVTTNSTLASYCSQFTVCDMNGDSNDDFVVVYKGSGACFAQLAYLGGGSETSASLSQPVRTNTTIPFYDIISISSGDINCNQCEDVVVEYANSNVKRCLTVFYGNFGGSFTNNGTYVTTNSANASIYDTDTVFGDFTGDGSMDVLAVWTNKTVAAKTMHYIMYSSRGSSISATSLVPYTTRSTGEINVPFYAYE